MKAIRVQQFGPPAEMKMEELPDPNPAAGQIRVRIHAIGVNPVDAYIRAGKHGKPALPFTPGKDAAGIVETLGPGVEGFAVGDRVYVSNALSGTYAEKAICAAETVHRLPQGKTFAEGASVGVPAGVAYFALFYRAAARPGETVLVHGGTGGVGTAAIQLARAAGLRVFATAGDEKGRNLVREQGAHEAFDHDITSDPARLMALTQGRGVDIILEMSAGKNLAQDLDVLAQRGRAIVIGSQDKVAIDPRQTMQTNADIRGVTLERPTPEEHRGIYAALTAALEAGILRPVIGMELPLAEAARAHELIVGRHPPGKIILRPRASENS